MKPKKISKLLFCLPLLAILWGCASDSESDFPNSEYPLMLSAQVEDASAPVLRNTADIGNVGIYVEGGTSYTNAPYTGTGGALAPTVQGYWGSTGDISIYAYAPLSGYCAYIPSGANRPKCSGRLYGKRLFVCIA